MVKLEHTYADSHSEWQIKRINNNLDEIDNGDAFRQRTNAYRFYYLAAMMVDFDNFQAVALDLTTSKWFFINWNIGAWRLIVYELPLG